MLYSIARVFDKLPIYSFKVGDSGYFATFLRVPGTSQNSGMTWKNVIKTLLPAFYCTSISADLHFNTFLLSSHRNQRNLNIFITNRFI